MHCLSCDAMPASNPLQLTTWRARTSCRQSSPTLKMQACTRACCAAASSLPSSCTCTQDLQPLYNTMEWASMVSKPAVAFLCQDSGTIPV